MQALRGLLMLTLILAMSAVANWTLPARAVDTAAVAKVAQLSYRCGVGDGPSGRFIFSSSTRLGGRNGHSTWREIQFKVDGGATITTLWRYDDFTAIAAQRNNARQFGKLLHNGRELTVRAIDQNGQVVEARFSLSDAAGLQSAEQACASAAPTLVHKAGPEVVQPQAPITTARADEPMVTSPSASNR